MVDVTDQQGTLAPVASQGVQICPILDFVFSVEFMISATVHYLHLFPCHNLLSKSAILFH
jgi:hypothetical protein